MKIKLSFAYTSYKNKYVFRKLSQLYNEALIFGITPVLRSNASSLNHTSIKKKSSYLNSIGYKKQRFLRKLHKLKKQCFHL